MTTYTDEQLKRALVKMLPEMVYLHNSPMNDTLYWKGDSVRKQSFSLPILDTELLHLCSLVERSLEMTGKIEVDGIIYYSEATYYACLLLGIDKWPEFGPSARQLFQAAVALWQQRTIALAKVKGVEIA